jgi:hypothetical protein
MRTTKSLTTVQKIRQTAANLETALNRRFDGREYEVYVNADVTGLAVWAGTEEQAVEGAQWLMTQGPQVERITRVHHDPDDDTYAAIVTLR